MKIFFKIEYTKKLSFSIFGSRTVKVKIDSVALVSEAGPELHLWGMSIRKIRNKMGRFLIDLVDHDPIELIGYDCAVETALMGILWPFIPGTLLAVDMLDKMKELAASLDDECFGIESEFSLQKYRHQDAHYGLLDKLEMLQSHPEFPDPFEVGNTLEHAKWISKAYDFKLLQIFLIEIIEEETN